MDTIDGGGRSLTGPGFGTDDGRPDPRLAEALAGHANGRLGEYDVATALTGARLLVPVVAVAGETRDTGTGRRAEADSEMALATLVGRDGRHAVLAFTGAHTLAAWRPDARPVPVAAPDVCATALDEQAAAVVVDVAGPAPFTVDGARLAALAAGEPVPPPHRDPDVLTAVHAVTRGEPDVLRVKVEPAESADLSVLLEVGRGVAGEDLAQRAGRALAATLPGRLARGVAFTISPTR